MRLPEHIDVAAILQSHVRTLRDPIAREYRVSTLTAILFVPIAGGVGIGLLGWPSGKVLEPLISAVSIVVGLLLNVLVVIYGLYSKIGPTEASTPAAVLTRDSHANIAFTTLAATVSLVLLILLASVPNGDPWWVVGLRCAVSAMLVTILVSIVMILRRVHALISHEMTP